MANLILITIGLCISLAGALVIVFPSLFRSKEVNRPSNEEYPMDQWRLDRFASELTKWVRYGAIVLAVGFAIQIVGMWVNSIGS